MQVLPHLTFLGKAIHSACFLAPVFFVLHYYYYYLSVCFNYLSFLLSIASPYQLYRKRSRARCRHSSEQRGRMGVLPRPSSLPCLLKRVLSHPRGEGAGGSPPSLLPRVLVGVLQPGAPGGSNFSLGSELPWGAEGKREPGRALGTPPARGRGREASPVPRRGVRGVPRR